MATFFTLERFCRTFSLYILCKFPLLLFEPQLKPVHPVKFEHNHNKCHRQGLPTFSFLLSRTSPDHPFDLSSVSFWHRRGCEAFDNAVRIPYSTLPHWISSVPGVWCQSQTGPERATTQEEHGSEDEVTNIEIHLIVKKKKAACVFIFICMQYAGLWCSGYVEFCGAL